MVASESPMPQSVEEAGALLGAAITRYGKGSFSTTNPPKGIHSSFAVVSPVPSSELLDLLHTMRSLLRSAPQDTPLVAAPSLLAGVLMKLLGISSSLAANLNEDRPRTDVPPMLSTAIRKVWVDCVVLCHSLGQGLSGAQRINLFGFVRDMIILAGLNPKTARALGGTRIAALEVLSGILEDSKLSSQLASWAFDVTQLCQRALKSSGNGEPTYRIAAIRAACSVVVASRTAFLKTRDVWGSAQFVLKGALEDRSIFELVKLLKIAVQNKYPEVRRAASKLACLLGPLAINLHIKSPSSPDAQATSPTTCLEEIMTLSFKNLDDESPHVSAGWAEALARCMCTSIELKNQAGNERGRAEDENQSEQNDNSASRGMKKGMMSADVCSTLPKALKYLVGVFIKVGGELTAPRAGGYFSTGGRAVRVGFARSIIHLLRLQLQIHSIGEGRSLSYKESILIILAMVGNEMEAQLNPVDRGSPKIQYLDATTVVTSKVSASSGSSVYPSSQTGRNLFGQGPKVSHADGCVARLLTSRVLRDGLAECMAEITQLTLLHELVELCVNKQNALKGNQLQVILIEISHLFVTLGEATASSLEQLVPGLIKCLKHPDHGVRYEAATACAAIASVFPAEGRKMARDCLNRIQLEHAELMSVVGNGDHLSSSSGEASAPRFRFGRNTPTKKTKQVDKTLKHQFAIHGMSLMVAIVVRDLPDLPGGLPTDMLDTVMSVCEVLLSTLTNDIVKDGSPSSACTCVRAGFHLISGALTTGPDAISNQIATIFGLWQAVCKSAVLTQNFTADNELMCVEALLNSIVTFLKFCAELLLSIPDALSRISIILENILPLFFVKGRLGSMPENPGAACRFDSAKAAILEAFAWLPPGSYPMIADAVFGFAASHIQLAIQNDVTCSILPSLISKEDAILDAISFDRAKKIGQVGGARDLGRDIIARTSEVAHHGDRESAFAFLAKRNHDKKRGDESFLGSEVLALLDFKKNEKPVTVLHQCGTWSTPVDPSCATRLRLVDSAIQAFASTFALRSGKEQQKAVTILQSLLPPVYFQNARNPSSTDQDRTAKSKDNLASTTNIVAVLLSCVKALPVDESTHDIPVGLGPSWKNKASTILLSLVSSPDNDIRRAAAEGLSLLATLGVNEDMRFLQSSILHSLDEVISTRVVIQGQGRNATQDGSQNSRSAGLLALGCIQRNTRRITESRANRSRLRGSPSSSTNQEEDSLQTIQIMTRVLPYVTGRVSSSVALNARSSALHAILMLFEYSGKFDARNLNEENLHLLKKAVEIVEDNYLAAWTIASHVLDQGNAVQKVVFESSFLSVLLRFMTFLTPYLYHLEDSDSGIAKRFSTMAMVIMESFGGHSVVQLEVLAFFEVLAVNQALLPPHGGGIKYDEHPILSCIPSLMANLTPERSSILSSGVRDAVNGCRSSELCIRATLRVLRSLSMTRISVAKWSGMKVIAVLLASLESTISSSSYSGETLHRGLAAPREAESVFNGISPCAKETSDVLRHLLYLERASSRECQSILLRYILLSRSVIAGNSKSNDEDDEDDDTTFTVAEVSKNALGQAALDLDPLFELTNSIRWQVKLVAVQMMTIALKEIGTKCRENTPKLVDSNHFNPQTAKIQCSKECNDANASNSDIPQSLLALHIPEVIACGCMVATATVDQVELRLLQENSMYCMENLFGSFGPIPDPDEYHSSVLGEYIPQLSSCIKSSLSAPDEIVNELTCRLFWAGCHALCSFLQSKITDDKAVLKRLIRPVMLTKEEVPFFTYNSSMPSSVHTGDTFENENLRANLLLMIGKIWMIGKIPLEIDEISRMVEPEKACIGVHAAALAIDGARLLHQSMLKLSGKPVDHAKFQDENADDSFFSFRDIFDIDDYSKAALVKTWASSANLSVQLIFDAINAGEPSETEVNACLEWLDLVIPLLFIGLNDSIEAINAKSTENEDTISWAEDIDAYEVACFCLTGLSTLAKQSNLSHVDDKWKQKIEKSTGFLYKSIILPTLQEKKSRKTDNQNKKGMVELVAKSCELFQTFSTSISLDEKSESSPFLVTLLSPLDLLEKKEISLSNDLVATIVAACLSAAAGIVRMPSSPSALVKAMLSVAMSLSIQTKESSEVVTLAAQKLLEECLKHESATMAEVSLISTRMAKSRNWAGWLSVVKINDGIAAQDSLQEIETALLNPSSVREQLEALGTVRELIQQFPPPNPLAGRILSTLGAEILSVFEGYGTLKDPATELQSKKAAACADCMKVALASYQQFSADFTDAEATEFLVVLFESFITVLRFNGLPNHPPPQGSLSDASIGRMCAQAITHIARTTPIPFKASMGGMAHHDRAVLEFAVRGEMSGYAVAAAPAPVKKKLSLKGFKKS